MTTVALRQYTLREEIFSCVVHGVGMVFGVAALTVLVTLSSIYGSVWGNCCFRCFRRQYYRDVLRIDHISRNTFPECEKSFEKI